MTMMEIKEADRNILIPLFSNYSYDRVLIDSVLEGNFGTAYADSDNHPQVARLDSGAFTMLGGDPTADGAKDLLRQAPIHYVTPQDNEWRSLLQREFGSRISLLSFTDFSSESLELAHLEKLMRSIPPAFELRKIDKTLAKRLSSDIGNEYFLENFRSVDDFVNRGVGFCILHHDRIVAAATSMAQSRNAIDIEIETVPDWQKQGLGTAAGANLVFYCLEHRIEPCWLAANYVSEKLALKLGYVRGGTYETCKIQ